MDDRRTFLALAAALLPVKQISGQRVERNGFSHLDGLVSAANGASPSK